MWISKQAYKELQKQIKWLNGKKAELIRENEKLSAKIREHDNLERSRLPKNNYLVTMDGSNAIERHDVQAHYHSGTGEFWIYTESGIEQVAVFAESKISSIKLIS